MAEASQPRQRTIFNEVAQEYDAIRPGYPHELIADIVARSQLPSGGRILEVGCGSGQATLPFAQLGYRLLCLELGPELAAIAARRCAAYPNVHIAVVAFEDWAVEPEAYDLVLSATAFHWIPPAIGYPKAAQALNETGWLAIFANEHPRPFTGFFADAQSIYQEVVPEWAPANTLPSSDDIIRRGAARIAESGLFEPVLVRTYAWSRQYTADQYVRLLNTYSDHHGLEAGKRTRLFAGLRELIEQRYAGVINKPYLSVLYLAQKRRAG